MRSPGTTDSPTSAKVDWSTAERSAWSWPEKLLPSDWCEQHARIPDNAINPEPGAYSFSRTPYLREIIDTALADPDVRETWIYKPTQVGFTCMLIRLICYLIDQDPGAIGVLYPDEDTVGEVFEEELVPAIDCTPAVKRHKTSRAWDVKDGEIWLDTMPVFGLYAGSVQKLARRSLRYVLADEIDKYRPFKNEASPLQLLKKRLSNWMHRARFIAGSTPTTRDGNICKGYESCPDKREYYCRCPHCGAYEVWKWSQVKGFKDAPGQTKFERANWVSLNQPAFYECTHCNLQITNALKAAAVSAGRWASQGQIVLPDGSLEGERPPSAKVGFHMTAMLSPWLSFSDLAAEFILAEGDADLTRDFRNARLALPWDEVARTTRPSVVREKKQISGPPLIVPKWAVALYATFDTQPDWFAGVIRAWGWGFKSALIWYGIIDQKNITVPAGKSAEEAGFDEVFRIGLESRFEIEGGGIATPKALLIDSGGDRTDKVYQFSQRDPRIHATKGMSRPGTKLFYNTEPRPGVLLKMVDTNHFKGSLWGLIHDPDPTKWLPHRDVPEQYCMEMASEHLVKVKGKWGWAETGTARNEAWDCEVLQRAAAEMDNIGVRTESAEQSPSGQTVSKPEQTARNPMDYRGKW